MTWHIAVKQSLRAFAPCHNRKTDSSFPRMTEATMPSNASLMQKLRNKWRSKEGICLALGAGVSASCGLPTWNELISLLHFRRANRDLWESYRPYPNYLLAASTHFLRLQNDSPEIAAEKITAGS